MENKKGSGAGALEKFFAGKGFYIVLFLCAAVIGVSAWTLLSRDGTVEEDDAIDVYRPVVSALPSVQPTTDTEKDIAAEPPEIVSETPIVQTTPEPTPAPVSTPASEPVDAAPESWLWPVDGAVEKPHSVDALLYDTTMGDWRTHNGLDIAANLGAHVAASASGTVTDIYDDPLYGTTVVISHGGGYETIYSNLAALPTVEIGDTVNAGDTIGAVGDTAICEAGEVYHLHFAMSLDGESLNPEEYLA